MSKEATCEDKRDATKEDIKDDQPVIQSSEENIKLNVESNLRYSDRQVTINEDVITNTEETSFMGKTKDPQLNNDKNEPPINNTHSSSTDDIISVHDITEDENIENNNSSRPSCLQCMSEIFECTIWFFRSLASSIRSRWQNCCSANRETVNIQNRKFDDDGEYWNGNVMNSDGESVICFRSDSREDGHKTKETFKHTDCTEIRNPSEVNEGFVDIGIKGERIASEHKPVDEIRFSKGKETGHRKSTISAVCHVNDYNENKDVINVANGDISSSGNNVCHDSDRSGHVGGQDSVPNGDHNVGHSGSHDGGHSGGHDTGSGD